MARPDVGDLTDRLFDALPALYRAADEAGDDWPLLRYLSTITDQASEVEALFDRFDPDRNDGISELVDPDLADADWLPWLAQQVGIQITAPPSSFSMPYGTLTLTYATYTLLTGAASTYAQLDDVTSTVTGGDVTIDEARTLIGDAEGRRLAGSRRAVKAVVAAYLTGTKRIRVDPHEFGIFQPRVASYAAETPDPYVIPGALDRAAVVPAAVDLTYAMLAGATYDDLLSEFGTYAAAIATGMTYAQLAAYVPTY